MVQLARGRRSIRVRGRMNRAGIRNARTVARGYRYNRLRGGVSTGRVRTSLGFPDRMITKLEYRTTDTLQSVYGGASIFDYSLNSIYDPEIALGGHQPLWTDQFAAIYNKYRVFACKYTITIAPLAPNGTPAQFVALASAQPTAALPTTIGAAWEQNRTNNRLLTSGPDRTYYIKGSVNLAKLQGQTKVSFKGDDGNASLLTTNPANPAVLRMIMESVNSGVDSVKFTYDIKLTYFVEFFDRITPHTS